MQTSFVTSVRGKALVMVCRQHLRCNCAKRRPAFPGAMGRASAFLDPYQCIDARDDADLSLCHPRGPSNYPLTPVVLLATQARVAKPVRAQRLVVMAVVRCFRPESQCPAIPRVYGP
jgi:hypothetical protein